MKRIITVALAALSIAGLASPASATAEVGADPTGDSDSSFADITSVGANYSESNILFGLYTRNSWPPSTWTSGDVVNWDVEVNGDSSPDYEVWWTKSGARVHTASSGDTLGQLLCLAEYTNYSESVDGYYVGIPASCIGTPDRVRVRGYIALGYSDAYDFAPSVSSYSPFAVRDGIVTQPTPQPTPPSTPQPEPTLTTAGAHSGYWMLTQNGTTYNFGTAGSLGSDVATTIKRTHVEPTLSGNGYWILAESGAVHAKGDAQWHGSALNQLAKGETAESLSRTKTGNGYWIFTNRGRVMTFGDAQHFGDLSRITLNGPILGSVATSTGNGYWMVGSDGGVFSFGDAAFYGSTGGIKLNKPVMALAVDPDGAGYWLVASDGGIFAFDAPFYGSMGGTPLNKPISGMVPGAGGYMMVGEDGGVFSFGQVAFHGSLGATPPNSPVVSVALQP